MAYRVVEGHDRLSIDPARGKKKLRSSSTGLSSIIGGILLPLQKGRSAHGTKKPASTNSLWWFHARIHLRDINPLLCIVNVH